MSPPSHPRRVLGATALVVRPAFLFIVVSTLACKTPSDPGCVRSADPACVPPPACPALTYACSSTNAEVFRLVDPSTRPAGLDALGAVGDIVLRNDRVVAIVDAPDVDVDAGNPHAHGLAVSGGNLLDLATRDGADHLNSISHIVGILPRDTARYESAELRAPTTPGGSAVVIVRGHLDGDARVRVVTRYELAPCDPGVRVRTEVFNGGHTAWAQFLADAYFWGDRSLTAFVPLQGQGFRQPPLDLLDLDASWRDFPWMAAQSHAPPHASYSVVSCQSPTLGGVNAATISAAGLPRTTLQPGDGQVFERMIFVASGMGLSGAASLAMDAHARLFGERVGHVTGRVVTSSGSPVQGGDERKLSVLFYEPGSTSPDDPDSITPWTESVPLADGSFAVDLPAGRHYRARAYRLGRPEGASVAFELPAGMDASVATADVAITIAPPATLRVNVVDGDTRQPRSAQVILVPTGGTDPQSVSGSVYGYFDEESCAPYLGPPHGGSPACNRALAFDGEPGPLVLTVPPGNFRVYATAGPAATLAFQTVTLAEGDDKQLTLSLRTIPGVFPSGSLSADFHVHGGRSFDTGFPDRDRVLSFLAAGVDVIAATDHDVTTSYEEEIAALGVGDRVRVMPGVEMTPLIPYLYPPNDPFPRVVGHFMAWPLTYDPSKPRNGAPFEEYRQPGQIFDLMRPQVGAHGVLQLNHPTVAGKIGRDEGYLRMLKYNPRVPLPGRDDGTQAGMLYARPGGGYANNEFDVQEAMSSVALIDNLQYRDVWFAFMNQSGFMRAGTANSDSHSLQVEPLGFPRNVVLGSFSLATFDRDAFNDAVRAGRMVGTTGPFVDASVVDTTGAIHGPSTTPFTPATGASIQIVVRAAPWIPVSEVRVVVNGIVQRTIALPSVRPADPYGIDGIERYRGSIPLTELSGATTHDSWIVVEAGLPLPMPVDTDADGLVDHIDANGDGVAAEDHLTRPAENDPRYDADVVAPGLWPTAFTNPFVLNVDGGDWTAPGIPR